MAVVATKSLAACGATEGDPGGQESGDPGGQESGGAVEEFRYNIGGPVATFWPMYVASDLGFLDEFGVDQAIAVDATNGVQQLLSGDIHAWGHSTDILAIAANRGGPLVGIAGLPASGYDLVVSAEVESISDLRGTQIGVALLAGSSAAVVRGLLRAEGVEDDEYDLLQTGGAASKIAALQSGAISASMFMAPQSIDIAAKDDRLQILSNTTDAFTAPMITSWVNSGWAEENRQLLVSWLAGQLRASQWLADSANSREAAQILADHTEVELGACEETYDQYAKNGLFTDPMSVDFDALDEFLGLVADTGEDQFEPAESYFDLSYLDEARKQAD